MNKRGSLFIEYTVFIVFMATALLLIGMYVQRGISGRWREAADVYGGGRQYQPNNTNISGTID